MEELLKYLLKGITGKEDVEVETKEEAEGVVTYTIKAPADSVGLIIGKKGKTIKTIRNLLKIKATLQKTKVNLLVEANN